MGSGGDGGRHGLRSGRCRSCLATWSEGYPLPFCLTSPPTPHPLPFFTGLYPCIRFGKSLEIRTFLSVHVYRAFLVPFLCFLVKFVISVIITCITFCGYLFRCSSVVASRLLYLCYSYNHSNTHTSSAHTYNSDLPIL